ncbi:YitT family protein [Saccharothrix mutabilis subsp. capreolus]
MRGILCGKVFVRYVAHAKAASPSGCETFVHVTCRGLSVFCFSVRAEGERAPAGERRPVWVARFGRLIAGGVLMGAAIAAVVRARAGMLPLDVLHAAVSHHTGWTMGGAFIATQATLLVAHAAWGIRPGVGTVVAAVLPAFVCDWVLASTSPPVSGWWRAVLLVVGGGAFALGVALYLSAGLGALPRDGLMAELRRRRPWLRPRTIRVVADLACLATGWLLLGLADAVTTGVVGIGSVLLSVALGPMIERLGTLLGRSKRHLTSDHLVRRAEFDATQPAGAMVPQADRMAALRALVEDADEPALSLWPALLSRPPVSTVVGPAEPAAMSLESFLDFARRNGAPIIYGTYVDDGPADELVPLHQGLVLQYPVPGGVVHCWNAVRDTRPRQHGRPARRAVDPVAPPVEAPGGPTGAVTALNQLTYLRLAR